MAPQTLDPMITFIITMTNTQELPLDQINTAFKFSEQYNGLCEILILAAEAQDLKIKLAWLAMKLHRVSHPRVRTRMIRYPTQSSLINLLETTTNLALGKRIVVTTDSPKIREEIIQMTNRNILITDGLYDTAEIHKVLAHTMHFAQTRLEDPSRRAFYKPFLKLTLKKVHEKNGRGEKGGENNSPATLLTHQVIRVSPPTFNRDDKKANPFEYQDERAHNLSRGFIIA